MRRGTAVFGLAGLGTVSAVFASLGAYSGGSDQFVLVLAVFALCCFAVAVRLAFK